MIKEKNIHPFNFMMQNIFTASHIYRQTTMT